MPGVAQELAPNIRRIVANNASPMTFRGTNTYLVGQQDIAVIDPGPMDMRHLEAILQAIEPGQRITHILVTHAHLDHSPLAKPLSDKTGVPIYAFGDAAAGRSEIMQALAATGTVGGGEGVDEDFQPDICVKDQESIEARDWSMTVHFTPGHMANHVSFALGDVLFSGDLVMSWATSLVSPPDGDLTAFMASLKALQKHEWSVFHAGHGAPVTSPADRLQQLITHRLGREQSIRAELAKGPCSAPELAARIYTDTPAALIPAATRNVLAHLIDLTERHIVAPQGPVAEEAIFALID